MGAGYGARTCVDSIRAHCESHPYEVSCVQSCPFEQCDSRKNPHCPCDDRSCDAFYKGAFSVQGQCRAVREQLVKDYVNQDFLYPVAEWARHRLEKLLGLPLVNATGAFVLPKATAALAAAKGCEIVDDLVRCVGLSVTHCNGPGVSGPCRPASQQLYKMKLFKVFLMVLAGAAASTDGRLVAAPGRRRQTRGDVFAAESG
jgi:hypothetical protein